MKPMIKKMKTRASRISVRTIALMLCFVMLLSAIGVGTVLTTIAKELDLSNVGVLTAAALNGADTTVPQADGTGNSAEFSRAGSDGLDGDISRSSGLFNSILGRIKEDIAATGWNSSKDRLHIRIGGTWYDKYFNSSGVTTFEVAADNTTIEFELNFNGTLYKLHTSQANFTADGIRSVNGETRKAKSNYNSTYTVSGVKLISRSTVHMKIAAQAAEAVRLPELRH